MHQSVGESTVESVLNCYNSKEARHTWKVEGTLDEIEFISYRVDGVNNEIKSEQKLYTEKNEVDRILISYR
jgi:hypothetical protein